MSSQQNGTPKIEAEAQDLNSGIQSQTKIWRTRIPEPLPLEKYPVFRLPAVLEEVIKKDFLDRQNNCNSELPVEFKSITDIITTKLLLIEVFSSNWSSKIMIRKLWNPTTTPMGETKKNVKQLLYKTEWKNAQKQATNFARQQKKRKIEDPGYVIVEFKATEHYGFIHLLRLFTKLPNLIYGCRSGTVWTYNGLKNIFNSLTPFIQFLVENKDVFQRAVNKNPAFNSGDNDDGDMVPKPKKSRLENYENGVNLDGAPSKITKSDKDDFQQPNMRLSRKKRIAAE
ncbi:Protein CBG14008 [Caenorhabditis briggsae]|uniref:Protein CBG14008 n=1 Tax=Caenorhabditis briggsae TaxID=6238 RepID=A8XJ70_CAEBR|nr:Protein CBG14008 [Caenorhabditis briggsae]CAP32695.2 Protein CBG14008 [Caenorhabditis briggsae]